MRAGRQLETLRLMRVAQADASTYGDFEDALRYSTGDAPARHVPTDPDAASLGSLGIATEFV